MPEATPTVTVTITETPESESPQATESFGPWPGENAFVDGKWPVGVEGSIPGPGILMTSEVYDCRWFVDDKEGKVAEKGIASDPRGVFVSVEDGDTFESKGCNYWQYVDVSKSATISSGNLDFGVSGTYKDSGDLVYPGTWKVGTQIPAGKYELRPSSQVRSCRFSVKKYSASRGYTPLIEYDLTFETGRQVLSQQIALKNGQLFDNSGCGAWVRQVWVEE